MTDEERYRLTHELYMLSQMRGRLPIVFAGSGTWEMVPTVEREIEIARRLGYKHSLDGEPWYESMKQIHADKLTST